MSFARETTTLTLRHPYALVQVSAFADDIDEAATRLSQLLGLAMPLPNRFNGDARMSLRATGPGLWQIAGGVGAVPEARSLRAALTGVATVVDLGHARAAFRLSGPAAARTLAKHCGLDLYASAFPTGSATNTRFNHLGATLARIDEAPTFELLVFRGYAVFVYEALAESGAEYGLQID